MSLQIYCERKNVTVICLIFYLCNTNSGFSCHHLCKHQVVLTLMFQYKVQALAEGDAFQPFLRKSCFHVNDSCYYE